MPIRIMVAWVAWVAWVAFVPAAGCGGGGGGAPDAPGGADAETGLCAGKPCKTSIDDEADWTAVNAPYSGLRCDFLEDGKYIAPATASAALQEIVFQDVEVHRLHLEFMTQVLPKYFGGLSPAMYQALVQRRATRQYWAGSIYRIVDEAGVTEGYGFDVITDPTMWEEDLTEAEVAAIGELLRTRFHLPLVYAPTTPEAIYLARSFTTVESHFSRACQHVTCDTPGVDCVEVPTALSLCGEFMEGRTIETEHAQKTTLAATPGVYNLPRAPGTHSVPAIFGGGEFGPARIPIAPASATATYTVTDYGSWIAHDYTQAFTAGAHTLEIAWQIALPQEGGGFLLAEPYVSRNVGAQGIYDNSTSYDDMIRLSSCTAADLEHWRITGTMAAGDGFSIDFQYEPPAAGSGPIIPTRAQITLGGATATVTDYLSLVYAGQHHNWNNQYWVLFDAPITYLGHPIHGLWLDEASYNFDLEAAHTLDAAHQPVDTLTVDDYAVARVQ
jgi:hypothetical protein